LEKGGPVATEKRSIRKEIQTFSKYLLIPSNFTGKRERTSFTCRINTTFFTINERLSSSMPSLEKRKTSK